jgi:hypothetical protein
MKQTNKRTNKQTNEQTNKQTTTTTTTTTTETITYKGCPSLKSKKNKKLKNQVNIDQMVNTLFFS